MNNSKSNKSDLVDYIADKAEISKMSAGRALDAALEGIGDALAKGQIVALVGFGTFSTSDRAARVGRNPKTGEAINIKARRVPGFKAGTALKQAVQVGK
jgi:DNA-binding protein HU-beta